MLGQTGPAQPASSVPQAVDQSTAVPDVQVNGERIDREAIEERAAAFVEEVADPPFGAQLARWNTPICVGVSNMRSPYGQLLIDRVGQHAADLGLEVGEAGCKPNVVIVATPDGRATASHLVEEAGLSFRPTDGGSNPSRAALRAFQTSDAPVRWWNVALPVGEQGETASRPRGGMGTGGGPPDAPVVVVHAGSRLTSSIRTDMTWVIIVIDFNRTGGLPLGSLADYVSMVALAQIDPDADLSGYDTILNAFSDPSQAHSLSDWDLGYLQSIYSGQANRANARQRRNEVVRTLVQNQIAPVPTGAQ